MEDHRFDLLFAIGHDTSAPNFRPSPRRRWHRNDWIDRSSICPCPIIANIFKIPDWARLTRLKGDQLANVQTRPPAKGNNAIVIPRPKRLDSGFQIGICRVWIDLREQGTTQTSLIQAIQRILCDGHIGKPAIRDQQGAQHSRCTTGFRQVRYAAGTKLNGGRVRPIGCDAHGLSFL